MKYLAKAPTSWETLTLGFFAGFIMFLLWLASTAQYDILYCQQDETVVLTNSLNVSCAPKEED